MEENKGPQQQMEENKGPQHQMKENKGHQQQMEQNKGPQQQMEQKKQSEQVKDNETAKATVYDWNKFFVHNYFIKSTVPDDMLSIVSGIFSPVFSTC
jgi:hypothetical protein